MRIYRTITRTAAAVLTTAALLTACQSEEIGGNAIQGKQITTIATIADAPQSRTAYEENTTDVTSLTATWEATERATLFSEGVYKGDFEGERVTDNAKNCAFTGTKPDGATVSSTKLIYPAISSQGALTLDFGTQSMDATSTTTALAGLKALDYMVGTFSDEAFSAVTFERKTSVLRLVMSGLPNGSTITALNVFAPDATLMTLENGAIKAIDASTGITLNITNGTVSAGTGEANTGTFTAYVMLLANADGSIATANKKLTFTATITNASPYIGEYTFAGVTDLTVGKCYTLNQKMEIVPDIKFISTTNDAYFGSAGYYAIYTPKGLQALAAMVNGASPTDETLDTFWSDVTSDNGSGTNITKPTEITTITGVNYKSLNARLMADMDLSSVCGETKRSWTPIGRATGLSNYIAYSGKFDGNGKKIKGLYINSSINYQGLFGFVNGSDKVHPVIKDVNIDNANVTSTGINIGILVGRLNYSEITNCRSNGGSITANSLVGGLIGVGGRTGQPNTIKNCSSTGVTVISTYVKTDSGAYAGGLIGTSQGSGSVIEKCYSTNNVSASGTGCNNVGGLAGANMGGCIIACYATGNVTGGSYVGGLVGQAYPIATDSGGGIIACYATGDAMGTNNVGGLVGYNYTTTGSGTSTYYGACYIYGCYATGTAKISSGSGTYIGGLVGVNYGSEVKNSLCVQNVGKYGSTTEGTATTGIGYSAKVSGGGVDPVITSCFGGITAANMNSNSTIVGDNKTAIALMNAGIAAWNADKTSAAGFIKCDWHWAAGTNAPTFVSGAPSN